MKTTIVLAMHGAPPNDLPVSDAAELFTLHARLEHASGPERDALARRYAELDARVRAWPRTPQNDPFHAASQDLARDLDQATGQDVIVGFNEFCAPDLDEAFDQAVARGAGQVVVVTPMMTRGGEHSEADIPAAIERARSRHPGTLFCYAWPFDSRAIAEFLAAQIALLAPPPGR